MKILVINSGSSSIKYKLFQMPSQRLEAKGAIEHIGEPRSRIRDHYTGLKEILQGDCRVQIIGHRVVHGAEEFRKPVIINNAVQRKIKQAAALAPLHNPACLAGITAAKRLLPGVKQVAVFDTAFHQSLPEYAYIYGLPYRLYTNYAVRKYGFHGTSHQYVADEAAARLKKPLSKLKIITCHLGNGCSITAIDKGRSVDTSMGFTPLEGVIMGTRCGDIDPALVTYLIRKCRMSTRQIDDLLNKKSGLIGISGISNDMRVLAKRYNKDKRAKLAVDIFVYRVKKYIAAYIGIIGGADAIVFTAGIGEHQRRVRNMIWPKNCSYLKKKPKILVIPTDEELMIARQAYELVK